MVKHTITRTKGRRFNPLILLVLATGSFAYAQEPAFDQAYDRIWKQAASQDLNTVLASADSLYQSTSVPVHRMRTLMLIARLHQQKEELEKSVEYALKIDQLAVENTNYTWQARANAYLAGLYRMMELSGKSRSYSQKALAIVPKIEDAEQANSTRGLLLQELGFASMDEEHYEQAIRHFKEAGKSMDKITKNREFNIMNNERLLGDNYRLLTRYDTALVHYHRALKLSTTQPPHYAIGLIYKGMAETLMETGRLPEAKIYLDKAERLADESQYLQLKDVTYDLSKRYYALVKDSKKLSKAQEKSNSVVDTILNKRAQVLNKMYAQLDKETVKVETQDSQKNATILAAITLIFSGGVFFVEYRKQQKRELAHVRNVLDNLNKGQTGTSMEHTGIVSAINEESDEISMDDAIEGELMNVGEENTTRRMMPIETEHNLLEKLGEFEKSDVFLEGGFSLASLAIQLDTNTKYLSYLIKMHRKTDFNSYINSLRVDFVMKMLQKDPTWRQQKISFLATASGFSSHSQFAAVFKAHTGISPSVFIKHLAGELD
ncbi:YesN/AraC family two-component response regulator [Dyadobacter sp. BE34]|uniref:YesN/AraC family two-component response regulator n=1 Tax=Dyadobacter fermentans TaxID=94254 RepID=A0ABU1R6A2_9BACT|nr:MULTISPECIES: helix-turn-helix domain-containing protein [Dyadobacter]MDR6808939.1 YesN/AraC family two-component response regulator [Dyadobacter fermentans]MDR7046682.1 YesN/AraC family two-component response regulator [Dyadobacter sp. BE242]MDR7200996.1 YesN/AraC family two-component response regulator [Dyadobacter sp. BE34]MDR7218956.1 YesN/AraC family two-component response regulator [Dyadobacter sp. BE31]MDR7264834.1 YesN/AraC family two-component response regulator [Dyadobacter sp. BE